MLKPASGQVFLWGKDLRQWDKLEVFRRVGLVLQDPDDQMFAASVYDHVSYGQVNLGLGRAEIARRVEEALKQVGLGDFRGRSLHQLSYGQKNRVAIAGIPAMHPEVIILDEPTAGLDLRSAVALMRLLKSLQTDHGLTVVFATHDVDIVPTYADRVYIIQEANQV